MPELELIRLLSEVTGNIGIVGILMYLLIHERQERRDAHKEHVADLRRWVDREHSHHDNLDD